MNVPTVTHDTFVIRRTYDSPVANVFRAWADPNRKARWFAGSAAALGNGYELDFQVGGREVNPADLRAARCTHTSPSSGTSSLTSGSSPRPRCLPTTPVSR